MYMKMYMCIKMYMYLYILFSGKLFISICSRDVPVLIYTVFRFRLFKNRFFGFGFGYSKIGFLVSVSVIRK